MKQRYAKLSHDLCYRAVDKLLEGKWRRRDVLAFIEEWTGRSRDEIYANELKAGGPGYGLKYEIMEELALMAEDMVDGIMHGTDPEFVPVSLRKRKEGSSGKEREIAYLDMRHQLLGHIVKNGLDDLFHARILPTQHASLPGKGQTALTRQVKRTLNRKLGIKYFQKTDCTAAYASTMYSKIIEMLEREIPRGKWIIRCMKVLERYAPGGHLIIGGYIDAWLFNWVVSYVMMYLISLTKSRRSKGIRLVSQTVAYMDDLLMMGRSRSGLEHGICLAGRMMQEEYDIRMRTTTGIMRMPTVEEEKARKRETRPGRRHGAMIDMGGYRIGRTHITLRERNAKKAIRCFKRAWATYQTTGTLKHQQAQAVIAWNSMIQNTNKVNFCQKYHVYPLLRVAKRVQAYWARVETRKRKERMRNVVEKHTRQRAALCGAA